MIKICSVVGARPQLIKEAVIQREISKHNEIVHVLIHTGQHYDFNMSGVFFEQLNMKKPDYFLGVSGINGVKAIATMMLELEKVFLLENPDVCIVYGDTNSTVASAIVANKLGIKLAHIEAGLRQEPKVAPEESNRVITDHLSDYLFAPTKISAQSLVDEKVKGIIHYVGDVMYDLFLQSKNVIANFTSKDFNGLENFVLLSLHRDFNVDKQDVLTKISMQIKKIAESHVVIFPIHPRTKSRINEFGLLHLFSDVIMIEPVDYYQLLLLLKKCKFVITDSGGVQKEAYFSGKSALVIMPDTSWRELTDNGYNILVSPDNLSDKIKELKFDITLHGFYGEGNAARRIIEFLLEEFNQ